MPAEVYSGATSCAPWGVTRLRKPGKLRRRLPTAPPMALAPPTPHAASSATRRARGEQSPLGLAGDPRPSGRPPQRLAAQPRHVAWPWRRGSCQRCAPWKPIARARRLSRWSPTSDATWATWPRGWREEDARAERMPQRNKSHGTEAILGPRILIDPKPNQLGARVVACDIAPGPLELAQEKAQAEGRTAHVPFLSIISTVFQN